MSRVCGVVKAEGSARTTDIALLFHGDRRITLPDPLEGDIVGFYGGRMRTRMEIDEKLMQEAMLASGAKTKSAAVDAALRLLVRLKAQEGVRSLRGKVNGRAASVSCVRAGLLWWTSMANHDGHLQPDRLRFCCQAP